MNPTVLSFVYLNEWMRSEKIATSTQLDVTLVASTVDFPCIFHSHLADTSKLYSTSPELIQILHCTQLYNSEYITALGNLPFPLIVIVQKGPPTSSSDDTPSSQQKIIFDFAVKMLTERQEVLKAWKTAKKTDEANDEVFDQRMHRILRAIKAKLSSGATGDLSMECFEVLKANVTSMKSASTRFLTMTKGPEEEPGDNKRIRVLTKPSTTRHFAFGAGNHITAPSLLPTAGDDEPEQKTPEELLHLDEVKLGAMTDPMSLFFRFVCGATGLEFTKLFNKIPATATKYRNEQQVLDYITCLKTTGFYAYYEVDKWVYAYSMQRLRIRDVIDMTLSSPLFEITAKVCALFMRDAMINNPSRGVHTKHSTIWHSKQLNDAISDMQRCFRLRQY
jgi:hypothetical protein